MEIAIAGTTLPCSTLCHVVCTLVATGITGTNVTSSVTTQPVVVASESLPEGYDVAYKVYDEHVSWVEARDRCIQNGARLAVIDSAKKLQYVKNQWNSSDSVGHVGIIRLYKAGRPIWVDTTGKELGTLPWHSGYPIGDDDCVCMALNLLKLINSADCAHSNFMNYVCEIPIIVPRDNRMTVN